MKRIKILFFYGGSTEPCIIIECDENLLNVVLENQNLSIYTYKIEVMECNF